MQIEKDNVFEGEVLLFINGLPPKEFPDVSNFERIYCTDGAYSYLKRAGIKPNIVSGDFDSLKLDEVDEDVTKVYTPNQDLTDFEKAIFLIKNDGYSNIVVFGGSGMEQDHFLGNIHSLAKYKNELSIRCFDDYGVYFFCENTTTINGFNGKILSLIPFPEATKITSTGVKYPLEEEDLGLSKRIGTRNTITEDVVEITFTSGNLLVFIQFKK
ncbi:thiamine pyrophosphokinase [Neptunitalea chrysea]|uniref:Thiamine diphosphokinase n=1 Tax=Neptunitalea chrysea TaxID=1647581 RepID=A0A9W6B3L4_9FLAO|nr:thiamine diphosphokinase [Neptunitalea chrysea]GLB51948.1 thiamine pyrophosphokinase [Neptunitalea chrysea]